VVDSVHVVPVAGDVGVDAERSERVDDGLPTCEQRLGGPLDRVPDVYEEGAIPTRAPDPLHDGGKVRDAADLPGAGAQRVHTGNKVTVEVTDMNQRDGAGPPRGRPGLRTSDALDAQEQ
jgi:hypothetical protein